MQATYAVFAEQGVLKMETETLDPAALKPTDLLIEAETSMVSAGTELAFGYGTAPGAAWPWRPGYGLVGRVREAGAATAQSGFAPGDRVFCFGTHASLQYYDASGASGPQLAFRVAETIPAEHGPLLRLALVALTGVQCATFEGGDTVAVFGLGQVGNLTAQLFQIAGARVIGLDPLAERCAAAHESGLETVLNVPPDEQVAAIKALTDGRGAQVVVDAVGHSGVIMTCLRAAAQFGQVILLGTPRLPVELNATDIFRAIHYGWLTVRGAHEWRRELPPYPVVGIKHSVTGNFRYAHDLLASGKLKVAPLISHVIRPDELAAAYEGLRDDPARYRGVIVRW